MKERLEEKPIVTHMGHSGFAVELDHTVLVFDYWKGTVPQWDPAKQIYVFSSHFHQDHFNMEVLNWVGEYPHIQYILSNDIHKKYNRNYFINHGVSEEVYDRRITFIKENSHVEIEGIGIHTFHSTDIGVAFLVMAENRAFFHAGDLNWWNWDGYEPEMRLQMEREYKDALIDLQAVMKQEKIDSLDAAFVLLDGHMDVKHSITSFDWFATHIQASQLFPMHYWDQPERIRMLFEAPCSAPYRERICDSEEY